MRLPSKKELERRLSSTSQSVIYHNLPITTQTGLVVSFQVAQQHAIQKHCHNFRDARDAKFGLGRPAGSITQARPFFLGIRTTGAGLAREERLQCIIHWLSGFVRCLLEAGCAPCTPTAYQISYGTGLGSGLAFGFILDQSHTSYITTKGKASRTRNGLNPGTQCNPALSQPGPSSRGRLRLTP